ncbi:arsenate reductase (glutaredoxin) [Membranicola marinus]|uniref:Arsenate reductase (Glutaredoxin) n=1 Tax=Membranihabitans marinus TaxID=1227546 RepID=A0A953HN00_9BACT|nr:arsenate reductase (glutaredoxin) [Membranihabitans marinus]MBY5957518.1 arsenate reductase (glutaredoxin) [Membranihabitans marinus]
MEIYHNPRCQKSRQTLKILQESKTDFEIRKYLDDPPSKDELQQVLAKLDIKPMALIRQNEDLFKKEYKGKVLNDEEWIDVMVKHPRLIERPIVIHGDRAVIGRPPENVRALLVEED